MKIIYLIRHGIAEHNILFNKIGKKAFYGEDNKDTKLTNKGHEQSIILGQTWKNINEIELVLCSSLTRTLETTENIFSNINVKKIALDVLKEYPQGDQMVNKRSNKSLLIEKFKTIDFSYLDSEEDEMWQKYNLKGEETIDDLNRRINIINEFIKQRPEETIAIVGHNSFIGQYKDKKIGLIENGDEELLHCHPYKCDFKL